MRYKILRIYSDDTPTEVIATGLTLEEAQEHCSRDDTRGGEWPHAWFDGYAEE